MCHSGSFRILLLVALAVLTQRVEGFAIRTTTADNGAGIATTQQTDIKVTKIWPLDAAKLDELQRNEIPSQDASSKTTTSILPSTGAPNETQTTSAYGPTTDDQAETTDVTTLHSHDENSNEIGGTYSEKSVTNTTSPQDETTTPFIDFYANIFAPVENRSVSTRDSSTNASVPQNGTSTEENIYANIVDPVKNWSLSINEVKNENASTSSIAEVNASTSSIEGNALTRNIAGIKNESLSTDSSSLYTTAAKKGPLSATRLENIFTNETLSLNKSTDAINNGNVSLNTSQINTDTISYNNSKNVSVNSNKSLDLLASDRKKPAAAADKFSFFVDRSHLLAEAASSNDPTTIAEHISYDKMNSIANTGIINSDKINMNTTNLIKSNLSDISENIPETTISIDNISGDKINFIITERNNVPLTGEITTFTNEILLKAKSAITMSETTEKVKQDLMTTEADSTSYSSKSVDINDTTTNDSSLGNSSLTNNTEAIRETTSTETSVTENTQYANEDITTSFGTKFILNEIPENTSSSINWKKNNVIDRTRANTEATDTTTDNFEILLGAGTAQDIENAFKDDQTALQRLKNKLQSLNEMSMSESSTEFLVTNSNFTTELPPETTENTFNFPQSQSTKPNVVSSLRAGFLDFSSRSTTTATETPSDERTVPVTSTSTVYSSTKTYIDETQTTPIPEVKLTSMRTETETAKIDKSHLTSKSLALVEDAIAEELMKEEIMSNSRELSWKTKKGEKLKKTVEEADINSGAENTADDVLAVRPISSERPKITGLYTVSPNYKRLKKIDVQAPKPFLRDPDDNSWRNESLSSRGIVFNANNSSKPFTQVLKNKTESVWNTLLENYNKEQPALRERLEKVAEMRKSKKKKFNQFGEAVYTDYEESSEGQRSVERLTMPTLTRGASLVPETIRDVAGYTTAPTVSIYKQTTPSFETTTRKTSSTKQYEYEDEDEAEYTLPNIDLKKFISSGASGASAGQEMTRPPPPPPAAPAPAPARPVFPERKPTLQYFPPRERATSVVMNDYDADFRNVVNQYTLKLPGKLPSPDLATEPARPSKYEGRTTPPPRRPAPPPPPSTSAPNAYTIDTYNEVPSLPSNPGAYVIKHFRDFIEEVISAEGSPPPDGAEEPLGDTSSAVPAPARPDEYSDYEDQFRRNVLSRFMDNFNQNSERFRSEFPLLYNTSVVHGAGPGARGSPAAESMAFMRRLYDDARAIQLAGRGAGPAPVGRSAPCDRTVELAPDYELHYYVPDGEEREEFQNANARADPYRLRL